MLLSQLQEDEFSALEMLGAVIDFWKLGSTSAWPYSFFILTGKENHASYIVISLNKANLIEMIT